MPADRGGLAWLFGRWHGGSYAIWKPLPRAKLSGAVRPHPPQSDILPSAPKELVLGMDLQMQNEIPKTVERCGRFHETFICRGFLAGLRLPTREFSIGLVHWAKLIPQRIEHWNEPE